MILDRFKLDGKVALVTGAGSGLGQAMAVALAEAGADVAVLGRRAEALAGTGAVGETESALGPLDILVNAAGVMNGDDTLALKEEDWRSVIDINLTGTFLTCQAAGEGMVARGRGSIINIATFLGDRAKRAAGRALYNASKAGVAAMTLALSVEWGGKGVRVNAISPGAHRTPMTAGALSNPEAEKWLSEKTVLGRVGEPEDIQGACVFLASDASSYITGANIFEDGGGWL